MSKPQLTVVLEPTFFMSLRPFPTTNEPIGSLDAESVTSETIHQSISLHPLNVDNWTLTSRISIAKSSTYYEINKIINDEMGDSNLSLTILAPTYGPWPYWKFPENNEVIPTNIRNLFVVDRSKPFLIALFRTDIDDRPLIIELPDNSPTKVLNIMGIIRSKLHDMGLGIHSAQMYGTFEDIKDQSYEYRTFSQLYSFPTALYVIPDTFEFGIEADWPKSDRHHRQYAAQKLRGVFFDCCDDFPGAVKVRQSWAAYQRMTGSTLDNLGTQDLSEGQFNSSAPTTASLSPVETALISSAKEDRSDLGAPYSTHLPQVGSKIPHQETATCADSLETELSLTTLEKLQYSGGGKAVYKGLPALSCHFVMRDEPWKQIVEGILPNIPYSEKAEPGPPLEQRIMVISGLGGCGKTQLVAKLAHEYGDKYEHIFFIDGSSLTSLRADLIARVRSVSSEYSEVMFKEAMSFLCNPAQPNWLIIYDNVEDVGLDMTPYLPQCNHGSIIITTRNHSLGTLATDKSLHISLDVMSPAEATKAILKSARLEQSEKKNQEAAGAIAKELGCLPVALIQAGCYIFEVQCSCEEYLGLLRKYRLEMMDAPAADRQRRSAYATFDISYKRLQPHLQKFLHMLSFCHYANFPMAVIPYAAKSSFTSEPFRLVEHGEEFDSAVALLKEIFFLGRDDTWDDRTVHQITTVLQKYSLASFVPASGSLLLQRHPLAHLWAYDRLTPEQRMTNYPKAEELKLENLRLQREQHGDFHRSTINAMSDLALTYQYQSRHAEAEALQVKVLEGTRAIIGKKHHETLNAMESLGYTYQLLGRYKEAEELHKVVYRERSEQMGPDQPHTLISMGHLGSIYFSQGRYAEAEEIQLKVLNGRREKLGSKHSYTLIAMGHLAVTYCSQGRYKESEALHKEVLEARIEELGEDHSDTLAAMSHVANIYRMQWRFEEAEDLQRKMIKSRSAALGENHLATLTDKSQLAWTFLSEGLYEEAESLQVEVLEGRMERLGESHPETVDAKATLIEIRRVQRRFTEAEGLAHDVYMDRKNRLGDNHPDTALTMYDLANIYLELGRLREAEKLAKGAVQAIEISLGKDHGYYSRNQTLLKKIQDAIEAQPSALSRISAGLSWFLSKVSSNAGQGRFLLFALNLTPPIGYVSSYYTKAVGSTSCRSHHCRRSGRARCSSSVDVHYPKGICNPNVRPKLLARRRRQSVHNLDEFIRLFVRNFWLPRFLESKPLDVRRIRRILVTMLVL
ncbi:hypothetical protein CPB86DRAFT_796703 [Serendipita vermifera]|nr:hypothetical protein CPB86DRAFT_796703 [Serendipita vermifera]